MDPEQPRSRRRPDARALARAAEVSEPTVIRFANAVGCEGFRDLRVKLARSIAFRPPPRPHSAIAASDDLDQIVNKIFDFNLSNITWVRAHLDVSMIAAAVKRPLRAPGSNSSAWAHRELWLRMPRRSSRCSACRAAHRRMGTRC